MFLLGMVRTFGSSLYWYANREHSVFRVLKITSVGSSLWSKFLPFQIAVILCITVLATTNDIEYKTKSNVVTSLTILKSFAWYIRHSGCCKNMTRSLYCYVQSASPIFPCCDDRVESHDKFHSMVQILWSPCPNRCEYMALTDTK